MPIALQTGKASSIAWARQLGGPSWEAFALKPILIFGVCGLCSGTLTAGLFRDASLVPNQEPSPLGLSLIAGALFLVGTSCAFALCRKLRWMPTRLSLVRVLTSAPIAALAIAVGWLAGLLAGVASAVFLHATLSNLPRSSFALFLVSATGLIVGATAAAVCIALALRLASGHSDLNGFIALLISASLAALLTLPAVLDWVRHMDDAHFMRVLYSLFIFGDPLFAASACYWLLGTAGADTYAANTSVGGARIQRRAGRSG